MFALWQMVGIATVEPAHGPTAASSTGTGATGMRPAGLTASRHAFALFAALVPLAPPLHPVAPECIVAAEDLHPAAPRCTVRRLIGGTGFEPATARSHAVGPEVKNAPVGDSRASVGPPNRGQIGVPVAARVSLIQVTG